MNLTEYPTLGTADHIPAEFSYTSFKHSFQCIVEDVRMRKISLMARISTEKPRGLTRPTPSDTVDPFLEPVSYKP